MKKLFVFLIMCMLFGCAGLQPAQSFDERLAYSYGAVTSVRISAADGLNAGTVALSDAQAVLDLSDQARAILDAAKAAHDVGDAATSAGKLAQVSALLLQMQIYTAKKGGAK